MPDVAASLDGALPTHIHSRLYALQNFFCSCYLVWAHHQQLLVYIKHAVLGQNVQYRMLGKECLRKVS